MHRKEFQQHKNLSQRITCIVAKHHTVELRIGFYVRVFNPFAQSHCNSPLAQCYRKQELEKKRVYEERVREVEHGTFSPLVFTTAGGLGPTATVVYKRLASRIAEKHDRAYGKTLHLIRCRLNFSLLR